MMMGTLTWRRKEGEGRVILYGSFHDADRIVKLDALRDWSVIITDLYNQLLTANAERTAIANTVANTDAIETEKPNKDG